jgi:putative ABC transport system ATP-binding protein
LGGNVAEKPLPVLETVHLSRKAGDVYLVQDVNIAVFQSEVVAIVGQSGAGKTSLIRLLNRLDEPTEGTVLLDGVDYRTIPPRELRRRVGTIMQRAYLFPGTVGDNIRFGPRQRGEDLNPEEVESLLARAGLSGFGDREVSRLSGGEAQRVSLARALANKPEVLLLDEPTSSLDEKSKAEVEELLKDVISGGSLTCVLVTHDLAQAGRLATRVMIMEKGRIVRTGLTKEVLDAYQNLS